MHLRDGSLILIPSVKSDNWNEFISTFIHPSDIKSEMLNIPYVLLTDSLVDEELINQYITEQIHIKCSLLTCIKSDDYDELVFTIAPHIRLQLTNVRRTIVVPALPSYMHVAFVESGTGQYYKRKFNPSLEFSCDRIGLITNNQIKYIQL